MRWYLKTWVSWWSTVVTTPVNNLQAMIPENRKLSSLKPTARFDTVRDLLEGSRSFRRIAYGGVHDCRTGGLDQNIRSRLCENLERNESFQNVDLK